MAQGDKATLYRALKASGYEFKKIYRDYKAAELAEIHQEVFGAQEQPAAEVPQPRREPYPPKKDENAELREQLAQLTETVGALAKMVAPGQRRQEQAAEPMAAASARLGSKVPQLDPKVHAGVTLNTHVDEDVVKVDEQGNKWFQVEVTKPSFAKPRARRVLKYNDPGVAKETHKVGEYTEEFEVAGDGKNLKPSEIKITLPSYQTGIYLSPNLPFRIHTYNGVRGFSMEDLHKFYGGADLVPSTIKRVYVSNDLCYDITTTIRAIENEHRERVLKMGQRL